VNGDEFLLSDYSIYVRDFSVSSIEIESVKKEDEGLDGYLDYGSFYKGREIKVPFYTKARDLHDYPLLRDEFYSIVNTREYYYVQEMRRNEYQDGKNSKINGKRYKVRLSNVIELEQMFEYGDGELIFETVDLPFAESVGTTQDIEKEGINSNDEKWGFGAGIVSEIDSQRYTIQAKRETEFLVYNAGNVAIHPFRQYLKLTIKDVVGSVDEFRLFNQSTQTYIHITEPLSSDDIVVFDGPNITKNSQQFFRNTRRTYIELKQGWNRFVLYHCDNATLEFDFRFYYI